MKDILCQRVTSIEYPRLIASISRSKIITIMLEFKVPSKITKQLKTTLTNIKGSVQTDRGLFDEFEIEARFKQTDLCSYLLHY